MEINGDVTMETNNKVKTELVRKSTKDCWTADFRNMAEKTLWFWEKDLSESNFKNFDGA